jgi:hypothetical protein
LGSLADLYREAFVSLLGGAAATDEERRSLLDAACLYCVRTYWTNGSRTLVFADATPEDAPILVRLLDSGIVVPVGPVRRTKPAEVRFFHDSMQSFLAARGLAAGGSFDALLQAAGAPMFATDAGILGRPGSELFWMCIEVFGPKTVLRTHLINSVRGWGHTFGGRLARDPVIAVLPPSIAADVASAVGRNQGGGVVVAEAVSRCEIAAPADHLPLAELFAALAPLVWLLHASDLAETQGAATLPPALNRVAG